MVAVVGWRGPAGPFWTGNADCRLQSHAVVVLSAQPVHNARRSFFSPLPGSNEAVIYSFMDDIKNCSFFFNRRWRSRFKSLEVRTGKTVVLGSEPCFFFIWRSGFSLSLVTPSVFVVFVKCRPYLFLLGFPSKCAVAQGGGARRGPAAWMPPPKQRNCFFFFVFGK